MNIARTALLLAAMTALFLVVGFLLGGEGGLLIAFLIALGMNGWAYWNSDKAVLKMHHARAVTRMSAPDLVGMVERLARRGDLPMPEVYILETDQPNAFATGRDPEHSAVAVTRGLMRACTPDELEGVIAHELAHIKNRDTLIMTITATLAGAIGFLAQFAWLLPRGDNRNPLGMIGVILAMIAAPIAAALVQTAISRTREYSADRGGAEICGQPLALASALRRIEQLASRTVNPDAERNPSSAHLFIVNPLTMRGVDGLFRPHPATQDRVRALQALAAEMGAPPARQPSAGRAAGPWG